MCAGYITVCLFYTLITSDEWESWISETHGVRQNYTLNEKPIDYRSCDEFLHLGHTYTHLGTISYSQPAYLPVRFAEQDVKFHIENNPRSEIVSWCSECRFCFTLPGYMIGSW